MVACPDCGRESARVHSRYVRTLADAADGGRPVLIGLAVRRLFCDKPSCGRRTFAEQVEGLTVRYQRRSPLLQHLVEMAGVLLASRGGARLLHIRGLPLTGVVQRAASDLGEAQVRPQHPQRGPAPLPAPRWRFDPVAECGEDLVRLVPGAQRPGVADRFQGAGPDPADVVQGAGLPGAQRDAAGVPSAFVLGV
ncbi:transposase family protein [Streptomyces shenzhenensis]|uniref:transposase family protein n=1 Tax=Streptomyces shenzhenensis TaxID=943815 RepID=UPI003403CF6A